MYEISAFGHFDAAHFLRGYQGKCANIHGHRWKVEVTLRGNELNELGILIDFMDVKNILKDVLAVFDHKLVNDVPPFDKLNPTAENLARFIFEAMSEKLGEFTGADVKLAKVAVWESEGACASYSSG